MLLALTTGEDSKAMLQCGLVSNSHKVQPSTTKIPTMVMSSTISSISSIIKIITTTIAAITVAAATTTTTQQQQQQIDQYS